MLNVDVPPKQYAKWKKPGTEGYIVYDSVCIKRPE